MHFWPFPPQLLGGSGVDSLQPSRAIHSWLTESPGCFQELAVWPAADRWRVFGGTIWKGRGMQLFYVRHTTAHKRRQESVIHGGVTGYVSVQIAVQITHTPPLHRNLAILASGGELKDDLRPENGTLHQLKCDSAHLTSHHCGEGWACKCVNHIDAISLTVVELSLTNSCSMGIADSSTSSPRGRGTPLRYSFSPLNVWSNQVGL
jgi:hypothetical protein